MLTPLSLAGHENLILNEWWVSFDKDCKIFCTHINIAVGLFWIKDVTWTECIEQTILVIQHLWKL